LFAGLKAIYIELPITRCVPAKKRHRGEVKPVKADLVLIEFTGMNSGLARKFLQTV
jgi:hypothetical protein